MRNPRILIVGAGIAGPTLAYWLAQHGFTPTVVERSEAIRTGGQAIDIHGKALDVMAKMGLLDSAYAARSDIRGMNFVDGRGKTLAHTTAFSLTGGDMDGPDIELMRSDLLNLLVNHSRDDCEYIFGDSVTDLFATDTAVTATFESGSVRDFDLVIGADGVNSGTRRRVFDSDTYRIHRLGRYIAIYTIPNFLNLDRWQTFYAAGADRRLCYFAGRSSTRVMFTRSDPGLDVDHYDKLGLQKLLRVHFDGDGWQTPRLLDEMGTAPDFYFDDLRQVQMDSWSHGRVALVGDAGYCASPASGLGTSLALVGAYVLAGELKAAHGDHPIAFARYEKRMRPFVSACQARARTGGNLYIGRSKFWWQMQQIRLSNIAAARRLMTRKAAGGKQAIANAIDLPDYDAPRIPCAGFASRYGDPSQRFVEY